MLRKLYYLLTPSQRLIARRLFYLPIDIFDLITGKRNKIMPPKGLIFIGGGDFVKKGKNILKLIIHHTGLKPDHRILDIGSGIGRLAFPLTEYLNNEGSYEGFDIVKKGVDWCNKHITMTYPNFKFFHIDLKNNLYNLKTENKAENFVFPYPDNDFDRIALVSVFTHMMPNDVDNYLSQINRVMKPNGKCFATFFIINENVKEIIQKPDFDGFRFSYNYGNYYLLDKNVEEADIAYDENYLHELLSKNNLKVEAIVRGWWTGGNRDDNSDFQDIVVIGKKLF